VIEFFSDLVSNAIAIIGQVKEIARHGLDQCRCRTHVPKSASQDSAPTRRLRRDGPGLVATHSGWRASRCSLHVFVDDHDATT
jgi:hypothetical protein